MVDILQNDFSQIEKLSNIKTFGLIVYNDENPNIIKLLEDEKNWKALSKVSGEKFYIFSVKPKKGSMQIPKMPEGMLGMMVNIWHEPNDNEQLLEYLDIESTKDLPLFVVFTYVGQYLLYRRMKINESNLYVALEQLKEIFHQIRDVTEKIHSEYDEHEAQVHDKISVILQKYNFWKQVKSIGGLIKTVNEFNPT